MRGEGVGAQVAGDVQKAFIDAVDMNILLAYVLQINGEDLRADLFIELHARRGDDIGKLQGGIFFQRPGIEGSGRKAIPSAFRILWQNSHPQGLAEPFLVHFLYSLNHLEQTRASRNAMCLQGGRYCEADRLFCPGRIGHDEIRGQRIISAVCQFHAGIERFEVDGNDRAFHSLRSF